MADKLDLVFKKIVSRQYSTATKKWYEENPGIPFKVKGSDVWVENIPTTPPTTDTAVIKRYDTLTLTHDGTVALNKSWYAKENDVQLGEFIQPRYGQGYTARLYDGNDNEIPTTDGCGWFFDYEAGGLTFDNNPASYGWNTTNFKIYAFRYVGATADNIWNSMVNTVWQEPILSQLNTPPVSPITGDRYLIINGDTGTVWEGHANQIAEYDGVLWQFITTTPGMISYDISQDKLYQYDDNDGWSWSGLDSIDLDYNNDNSELLSITVKEALDELDRLVSLSSNTLHVDVNRTDTYYETGSINKPYKLLTTAIANVPENGIIKLVGGEYDGDGLTIPNGRSLISETKFGTTVTGTISIGTTTTDIAYLENIKFDEIIFNGKAEFENVQAKAINIGSQVTGVNLDIIPTSSEVAIANVVLSSSTSKMTVTHGSIVNFGDERLIKQQNGELTLHNFKILGNSPLSLLDSDLGKVELYNTSIINEGDGLAVNIDNGATILSPNKLVDIHHVGDINTGSAITIVEGVTGGNPISTVDGSINQVYRGSTQLRNESTIIKTESGGDLIGLTVNDGVNRVAEVVKYDQTLGEFIINACVDDIP